MTPPPYSAVRKPTEGAKIGHFLAKSCNFGEVQSATEYPEHQTNIKNVLRPIELTIGCKILTVREAIAEIWERCCFGRG